ncbi:MAG: four-carbon acid sugar kinase family protein [Firmicutes bacterium]|nr:four-carbon acid sugar kinase family protein [Bacillota bacterium]
MIQLLIVADDFTGALDTGVKLSESGIRTKVDTRLDKDVSTYDTDVLVVDTESRHLSPEEAYRTVYQVARTFKGSSVEWFFKKTDSGLRGNIGAELTALMDGLSGKQLAFVPEFPSIGRITKNGVHYIDGVPVSESVFGIDLLNPVRFSRVDEIIHDQSDVSVTGKSCADLAIAREGISVYDAETDKELHDIILSLKNQGVRVMGGCAGAGAYLPELLNVPANERTIPRLEKPLFAICGSINPVTVSQVEFARSNGFAHFRLKPEQKLQDKFWESTEGKAMLGVFKEKIRNKESVVVDAIDDGEGQATVQYGRELGFSVDEIRRRISHTLALLFKALFEDKAGGTLMIIGGDTLQECMVKIGNHEMEPIYEMSQGVVLAKFSGDGFEQYVLTKSGGFGEESLLRDLAEQIEKS